MAADAHDDDTAVPLLTLDTDHDRDSDNRADYHESQDKAEGSHGRYLQRNDSHLPTIQRRTPLPLAQLLILCVVRLAEPIAYTQIFPYINQMMEDMKVTDKPSEIGYYSGTVDSIFAVCQLFTIFQWGRLSDRIGRKPVILLGLAGVAMSSTLFGMSKSLLWAVVSRSMAGALSGNVAVVQSVISEITDETNQGQAFPLTGLSWNLGCIIGPMIGGNFVHPAETYPNTLGQFPLLKEYPYLLPCVVSAILTACAIVGGIMFLKETLPSKVRLDTSLPSPISARATEKSIPKEQVSVKKIMASPVIRSVFTNYFLISILGCSFDVVFILLSYTPVRFGGLSRKPEEIGYALALSGIMGAVIQVLIFPVLQRRYDNLPLYRALMFLWPVVFGMLPLLNLLARRTAPAAALVMVQAGPEADDTFPAGPLVWIGIGVTLGLLRIACMCFSLNQILIKNASPSQEALGSTFGLAQSVASVARAGSPAMVSSLFAVSKERQLLGGNFVWVVMFSIALLGLWSTFYVRDGAVERSHKRWEEGEMHSLRNLSH